MGIGLTEEHQALADSVRGFAGRSSGHAALAGQGLLGLHLPEEAGGQGYGLLESCVALEALGEQRVTGAYLPTVVVSAALAWAGAGGHGEGRDLLRGLADGSSTAAVVPAAGPAAGSGLLALGPATADLFLVPVGGGAWAVLDRAGVVAEPVDGVDLDRELCSVTVRAAPTGRTVDGPIPSALTANDRATGRSMPADRMAAGWVLDGVPVREIAAVLLGADACGVAAWAVTTAAEHAKVREQFGRPIGQFQGVKHRVAAALVALEQARAAVWDAARAMDDARTMKCAARSDTNRDDASRADAGRDGGVHALAAEVRLAVGVAAVLGPDAAVRCTADTIQVLGGIGYTFEHDAHRYYRRALSGRMLAGDPGPWAEEVAGLAVPGTRRRMEPDLPEEAAAVRDTIRAQARSLRAASPAERRDRLAREGWIMPYLPRPCVFVPDDHVVGEVDAGWRVARDTLSHERVALGDSWGPGSQHTDMAELITRSPPLRQSQRERAGRLWAEGQAISALGLRATLHKLSAADHDRAGSSRRVPGGDPGTASSVRKLLGMRHAQAISEFCWSLAPADRHWNRMILTTRAFTIGGGTTEVQLNIIAERALGLPRDP
ncbi:acyl-CoA dehydrogenase [Nonomuraea sp. B5E05]|uniref:acyl-CoA dehydrogenase n=1 Tax=Nonomuraea sp. B5E05 TaxID=3153569 RepID=UPI0032617D3E